MKTKTQTPRATRHVPSTGAKHSIQIAWRRPSSDLKRRCRRLLRLLKKRSVPRSSRHRLSARAVSDSFGFIFSFALSVSLCVFCVFVGWIAESEDFFSRGAEAREFFSRETARKRRSLSRGSTQEKEYLARQHARGGVSRVPQVTGILLARGADEQASLSRLERGRFVTEKEKEISARDSTRSEHRRRARSRPRSLPTPDSSRPIRSKIHDAPRALS
jgi:hypothetical protein